MIRFFEKDVINRKPCKPGAALNGAALFTSLKIYRYGTRNKNGIQGVQSTPAPYGSRALSGGMGNAAGRQEKHLRRARGLRSPSVANAARRSRRLLRMRLCHQPLRRVYHLQGRLDSRRTRRQRPRTFRGTLSDAGRSLPKGLGAYPEGVSPCHTGRIRGVDRILRAAGDEGERKMGMARCLQRDDRPRRALPVRLHRR